MALAKTQEKPYASTSSGITIRGVGIGILASALISAWITYARTGATTSDVNITHLPVSLFAIFILITSVNLFYRKYTNRTSCRSR